MGTNKRYRRAGVALVMGLAFLLILTGCGVAGGAGDSAGKEKYVIRVPLLGADSSGVNVTYAQFEKNLEAASDGRFDVQIFGSGTLTPSEEQMIEMIDEGSAELTSVATGTLSSHAGANKLSIFDVPFLLTTDETLYKFIDGDLSESLYTQVESLIDAKAIGMYDRKGYNLFNNVRPVASPVDMKGLKIRTSSVALHVELLKELGASPMPISFGEAFTALQQGTVDGIHFSTDVGYADKYYEVSKYLTLTRHVSMVHMVILNRPFYESLPVDLQGILDTELTNLIVMMRESAIKYDEEALAAIKAAGIEVTELSEAQTQVFRDSAQKTTQQAIALTGQELYDAVLKLIQE